MSQDSPKRRGRKPNDKPKASDLRGAKYLSGIMDLLAPLREHCRDPKRRLHFDQYCAWLLLYFFSPTLTSLRGLQQASDLRTVRRKLGLPRFSLGSFSEAGNVFDPDLLVPIIEQIGERLGDIEPDTRLAALERRPVAVDATLLHALPKMVWALWRDEEHHAAKLHLQLDLLKGAPQAPCVTSANASETRTLAQHLAPGRLYLADRGFFDYDLMAAILAAESSFVTRVRDNIGCEIVRPNPIDPDAARRGVEFDAIVTAGSTDAQRGKIDRPLRLVRIHVDPDLSQRRGPKRVDSKTKAYRCHGADHTLVLLTDQLDLDVELIGLLYRYRWQIELFFRWFKKVLAADRLLALSQSGMTIVVYCALIASLLVTLWTGRKPTKRTFEMICFYFSGWASQEELIAHLRRLEIAEKKS
jgi:hypothetical protein